MLELWIAIPVGFALKMNPLLIGAVSAAGSIWSVLFVVVTGEKAVSFIIKIRGKSFINKTGRSYKFWEKYGIPGLGLISPLLLGAPLGAAIGISMGSDLIKLIVWISIGVIIWTTVLTALLWLGIFSIHSVI